MRPWLALAAFVLACTPEVAPPPFVEADASFWLRPASASAGVPRAIELVADGATLRPGEVTVDFGPAVAVQVLQVRSSFRAVAQVLVADDAPLGPRDVTVAWAGGQRVLRDAFTVEAGSLTMTPGRASLGETIAVQVQGWGTRFDDRTVVSLGDLDVRSVTVLSPSSLRAVVQIPERAAPGRRDLVVYDPTADYLSLTGALLVDRDRRALQITPDTAEQRQTLEVRVHVDGGDLDGVAELDLGTGVVVEAAEVLGPEWLQARLRIGNNATPGPRDVVVRTPELERVLPDGFTIVEVAPDPSKVRTSISYAAVRTFREDTCSFRVSSYATVRFYETNDFPCPSAGSSSSLSAPPLFDFPRTGYVSTSGGSTDCPPTRSFNAGPWVRLDGGDTSLLLPRVEAALGSDISYRLDGMAVEDYAWDTRFDLLTPGGEEHIGTPLPPMQIAAVMDTLRRDVVQTGPDYCDLLHPLDEPLSVRWDPAATYDVAQMYLYVTGSAADQGTPVAMIYPWDDGRFDVDPQTLAFFPEGPASVQQTAYRSTRFEVPGSTLANAGSATSIVQWRGTMWLVE